MARETATAAATSTKKTELAIAAADRNFLAMD